MRKWICLLAVISMSGCANMPEPESKRTEIADEKAVYTGPTVRRWSPLVSDLDETIRLYRDILGFELGSVGPDPQSSFVYDVYNIDRSTITRHALFHAGDKKRVLSVVEVPGMKPVRSAETPRRSALLINANGRFDQIKADLEAAGYETIAPQRLATSGIEMGFIDKDGNLYALYEIPYTGTHKFD